MGSLNLIKYGAPILRALEDYGVTAVVCDDFDEVCRRQISFGKEANHPMLDPARNDFVRGEAFWLFLEKDGRTIAGLAAKFSDLAGEGLDSYLRRTSRNQYGRETDPIISMDSLVRLMNGRVIYFGELKILEKEQGNIKMLARYTRLMQLLAAAEWDFDWMYGFVASEHVVLNRLYKFNVLIRDAVTWRDPAPHGRLSNHAMVASTRRQLDLMFRSETE